MDLKNIFENREIIKDLILLSFFSLIFAFFSGIFGGLLGLGRADKFKKHYFENIFSNKNNKDLNLIKIYKNFYFHISKEKQETILNYYNSLSKFEQNFINKYIRNDASLNKNFFYTYCYNYIIDNNKKELEDDKEFLFLLIDEIDNEYNQEELINLYIEKIKTKKYKSNILNQAESLINEKDYDKDIEINKNSIIKQI